MKPKGQVTFNNKDQALFFITLKKRVEQYFIDNNLSRNYNSAMVIKTIVLLSTYLLPFAALLAFQPSFGVSIVLWLIMGFSIAGVGMGIMHDANHEAYTTSKTANYWLGHTLNLLGGSVHNWKLQHNILHHTYTNIVHMDDDCENKLVLKFSPHTSVKGYHRFQFIYVFFFYGILTLYWTLLKDFIQFFTYSSNGVNQKKGKENKIVLFKIVLSKLVYFFCIMFVPVYFFHIPFYQVLTGFLLMHFVAGLVLTVVFQLAHSVEDAEHPLPDENGMMENNWAIHQMKTTINFARHNKILSWYLGGLNFQVEHHLFPRICHVHYPNIAPIVKATAEEFGVPYLEKRSFWGALDSHIKTLKKLGRLPDINEALA